MLKRKLIDRDGWNDPIFHGTFLWFGREYAGRDKDRRRVFIGRAPRPEPTISFSYKASTKEPRYAKKKTI